MKSAIIPKEVANVSTALKTAGFEAFLVGGCVRDLLITRKPKDWDLTTNATPDQIQKIFPDSFCENDFGTVGLKTGSDDETLKVIEITPYRLEGDYSDRRHPDQVIFSQNLLDDLNRRDFTINAIALELDIEKAAKDRQDNIPKTPIMDIKDIYGGVKDIKDKVLRAVGDPDDRFNEDALRMLRAIRLSAELNFVIEQNTAESIARNSSLLKHISRERIGEEFRKIIMSDSPSVGIVLAEKLDVLRHISPVSLESVGVSQNKQAHKYDVWEHSLRTLQHAADKNFSLEVRLAAFFHDIAKPATKRTAEGMTTFYNHEVVGARVARETLKNLAFSRETIEKVEKLVRYHMFFADTEQITHSAVRRLVSKVGKDNVWDLINLRICDRIGTGRPKAEPYRLRKYQAMIEEVSRDPISVGMLKIDGNDLMKKFQVEPGPKIGHILHALLDEVLDDPSKNTKKYLHDRVKQMVKMDLKDIAKLGEQGRSALKDKESQEVSKIRRRRFVD